MGMGTGCTGSEYGLKAGCSQYEDESTRSVKGKEFLQQLGEDRVLKKDNATRSSSAYSPDAPLPRQHDMEPFYL
jgi:hypothetical protein